MHRRVVINSTILSCTNMGTIHNVSVTDIAIRYRLAVDGIWYNAGCMVEGS